MRKVQTEASDDIVTMQLHHRICSLSDLQDVFRLYMDPESNPFLTYDPMNLKEFELIFRELVESKTLFVVELGDKVVGSYRLVPKTFRQRHTWYLGGFVVDPAYKGKGIGYRVLKHIGEIAKDSQIRRIELTVSPDNQKAIHLYKKAGYEIEGTIKSSYFLTSTGDYYDEYLMALILS